MNNKAQNFVLLAILTMTACGQSNVQTRDSRTENAAADRAAVETVNKQETECKICDFDLDNYKGELSKDEVNGLLLALNDEYMALATYQQVNKDLNDPHPFINIEQAEARHADRLKMLFETYKMPVPENKWLGNAPKFASVQAACQAGVDAEIANRDLYTKLFASTEREDILVVYRALQRASAENHLPAFKRCGGGGGGRAKGMRRGNN